jgi:hypothetical protein
MYDDGTEAAFWLDAEECARECKTLLANDVVRRNIALAGQLRHQRNRHWNEQVLATVLSAGLES